MQMDLPSALAAPSVLTDYKFTTSSQFCSLSDYFHSASFRLPSLPRRARDKLFLLSLDPSTSSGQAKLGINSSFSLPSLPLCRQAHLISCIQPTEDRSLLPTKQLPHRLRLGLNGAGGSLLHKDIAGICPPFSERMYPSGPKSLHKPFDVFFRAVTMPSLSSSSSRLGSGI